MLSKGVIIVTKSPGGDHTADGGKLLIENWVSYEHGMVRTAEGWKVNRILSDYVATRTASLPGKQ